MNSEEFDTDLFIGEIENLTNSGWGRHLSHFCDPSDIEET